MQTAIMPNKKKVIAPKKEKVSLKSIIKQKYLLLMSIPFVIWAIIFNYIPLWGWLMAFQNYKPQLSIFQQEWVGLKQFQTVLTDNVFWQVMRNTLCMSFLNLIASTIAPIVFALLLNEIINTKFKKVVQTVSYLPHFVSWVLVAGIATTLLSTDGGIINIILMKIGLMHKNVNLLTQPKDFWNIVTIINMWKETGWNAIIYFAAISGVDPALYEAARVDGANRFKQMWHVTLPGIKPTIVILLVLGISNVLNTGIDISKLMGNPLVQDYSQNLDLYTLNMGINQFRYSFGTAIGMFKSVVSLILIFTANKITVKLGEGRVF